MLMVEKTIEANELIHVTSHNHHYVNPYYGCSEGCPYCYWADIPGWSGKIDIRVNAPQLFEEYTRNWNTEKIIYIGSCCNPYEDIEQKYRLTRKMLITLKDRKIKFLLTTSTNRVLNDVDLLLEMKDQAIIVFELCRINRIKNFNATGFHEAIVAANALAAAGITVWATLGPILPGITNLGKILERLNKEIPVYVSPMDAVPGSPMHARVIASIQQDYPELTSFYEDMIRNNQNDVLFEQEIAPYLSNPRVKRFPFPLD